MPRLDPLRASTTIPIPWSLRASTHNPGWPGTWPAVNPALLALAPSSRCLDLAPVDGWTPSWRVPLLVLLPLVSLVIGALLLFWSVSHHSRMRLLYSLIPASFNK